MKKKFTKKYNLSKTLKFELIPINETLENFKNSPSLIQDEKIKQAYPVVKEIIDAFHADFITYSLAEFSFDPELINKYRHELLSSEKKSNQNNSLDKIQEQLRKALSNFLKKQPLFKDLLSAKIFNHLESFIKKTSHDKSQQETQLKYIHYFNRFNTYFTGFFKNRSNIYSSEAIHGSLAFRIVHDNLPIFFRNIDLLEKVKKDGLIDNFEKNEFKKIKAHLLSQTQFNQAALVLKSEKLSDLFSIMNINLMNSQIGIDVLNTFISGISQGNLNSSIKGLNQYLKENSQNKKQALFTPLKKQILGQSQSASNSLPVYQNDSHLLDEISEFMKISERPLKELEQLNTLLLAGHFNENKIYLKNDISLQKISTHWLKDWAAIQSSFITYSSENSPKKTTTKELEKIDKAFKNQKSITLAQINTWVKNHYDEKNIIDFFKDQNERFTYFKTYLKNKKTLVNLDLTSTSKKPLIQNKEAKLHIKNYFDSLKSILHYFKPLFGTGFEANRDHAFYAILDSCLTVIEASFYSIYNKTRNYLTKKPYSLEKFKLNFECPTLLNGWDQNKEKENLGSLLMKDGQYFLAIRHNKHKKVFDELPVCESDKHYQKMIYKYLPGPNKMFPKVFFPKSDPYKFNPTEKILKIYKEKRHILGETFNLDDCHELIDFFKKAFKENPSWSMYNPQLSDTKSYTNISDFYREIEAFLYKISFTPISENYVHQLVKEGKLFLFKIHNKDFSLHAKGKPNLHTLYWNSLFDEKNLEKITTKLNGEAELFYRKKSLDKPVTHPKLEPIKNKNNQNPKKTSTFSFDLVKDRRFTTDKFFFHVPITLNYLEADCKSKQFNLEVLDAIKNESNLKILGIDRGENHLLYLSLIDLNGEIKYQESLNIISNDKQNTNYLNLLKSKEKQRDKQRKDWSEIENIKELKSGYLSQAIHKITELMLKENAIVVLEDLNFGFKTSRQHIERQVYQKFEKMLIEKLNFLVDKNKCIIEDGGVLKAYQFTPKFSSFQKLGKQCGHLFYVPASYTSVMDPTTGFAPVYKFKSNTTRKQQQDILNHLSNFKHLNNRFTFTFSFKELTPRFPFSFDFEITEQCHRDIFNHQFKKDKSKQEFIRLDLYKELHNLFEMENINISNQKDLTPALKNASVKGINKLFFIFDTLMKLRYYCSKNGEKLDYIISPVKNQKGHFFDSRIHSETEPCDGDANGAYHIALKGLCLVKELKNCSDLSKFKLNIKQEKWFHFAREIAQNK